MKQYFSMEDFRKNSKAGELSALTSGELVYRTKSGANSFVFYNEEKLNKFVDSSIRDYLSKNEVVDLEKIKEYVVGLIQEKIANGVIVESDFVIKSNKNLFKLSKEDLLWNPYVNGFVFKQGSFFSDFGSDEVNLAKNIYIPLSKEGFQYKKIDGDKVASLIRLDDSGRLVYFVSDTDEEGQDILKDVFVVEPNGAIKTSSFEFFVEDNNLFAMVDGERIDLEHRSINSLLSEMLEKSKTDIDEEYQRLLTYEEGKISDSKIKFNNNEIVFGDFRIDLRANTVKLNDLEICNLSNSFSILKNDKEIINIDDSGKINGFDLREFSSKDSIIRIFAILEKRKNEIELNSGTISKLKDDLEKTLDFINETNIENEKNFGFIKEDFKHEVSRIFSSIDGLNVEQRFEEINVLVETIRDKFGSKVDQGLNTINEKINLISNNLSNVRSELESELNNEIKILNKEMNERFNKNDVRYGFIESKLENLEKEFDGNKKYFDEVDFEVDNGIVKIKNNIIGKFKDSDGCLEINGLMLCKEKPSKDFHLVNKKYVEDAVKRMAPLYQGGGFISGGIDKAKWGEVEGDITTQTDLYNILKQITTIESKQIEVSSQNIIDGYLVLDYEPSDFEAVMIAVPGGTVQKYGIDYNVVLIDSEYRIIWQGFKLGESIEEGDLLRIFYPRYMI